MKRLAAAAVLWIGVIAAQPGITLPQVGLFLDTRGNLRPLYGLAGNFLPGQPAASAALSAAFSGRYGWIKTADRLVLVDEAARPLRDWPAPGGAARFGFSSDGAEASAYLPETARLVVWRAGAARVLTLDQAQLAGEVVAVGVAPKRRVALAVQRDSAVWLVRLSPVTGVIEDEQMLPGVSAPLLLLADGRFVFAHGQELIVRALDGSERSIAAGGTVSGLSLLGQGWIEVTLAGESRQPVAVRLSGGEPELYRIPEVAP